MNLLRALIDIIYPPRCAVCRRFLEKPAGGLTALCRACADRFVPIRPPHCPVCGKPFSSGPPENRHCGACLKKRPAYAAARAPYLYEGVLMEAVHRFKYGHRSALARDLGPLLSRFAADWPGARRADVILPVPLHPKRLRERGFNQSLLLARHVAAALETPLDYLSLRRTRYTRPQAGLGKKERRKNVRRAFRVVDPGKIAGKTLLVVDDVATTGNTLDECAGALLRAGGEKVYCLVLAKAGTG